MTDLRIIAAGYQRLREALLAYYPELAEDEQALADTIDGEVDLDRAIAAIMASREDDLALVEAIKSRATDLTGRRARIEARAEAKRQAVLAALIACDRRKMELAEVTLSVTPVKPSVVIDDEAALPPTVFEPQPPKVSRTLIKLALEAGQDVPGAHMSNGNSTLTVRRK